MGASFRDIFFMGLLLGQITQGMKELRLRFQSIQYSALVYKSESEGKRKKKKLYEEIKREVNELNRDIKIFNGIREIKWIGQNFEGLKTIDLKPIKKIIDDHKGDYPAEYEANLDSREQIRRHVMGTDSSASSLSII